MRHENVHARVRRAFMLLIPAAIVARFASAQSNVTAPDTDSVDDAYHRVTGKKQQDEILKAEYEQNVKDARDLVSLARSFEEDLEKDDRYVLSLPSLKKLDDMEKLTKRIRGRLKHY